MPRADSGGVCRQVLPGVPFGVWQYLRVFCKHMAGSRGGEQAQLAMVGGFDRRQNSGHPLFSMRVRSRREPAMLTIADNLSVFYKH